MYMKIQHATMLVKIEKYFKMLIYVHTGELRYLS